jgi:hypothetical protein
MPQNVIEHLEELEKNRDNKPDHVRDGIESYQAFGEKHSRKA